MRKHTHKKPFISLNHLLGYDDMPMTDDGIIECLCSISEKKKMKAAVKHYKSCAFCGAVFPIVGAFLGGTPGIAVGE